MHHFHQATTVLLAFQKKKKMRFIGSVFKKIGLPTVILQEGGYHTQDLGKNVVSLLNAFV